MKFAVTFGQKYNHESHATLGSEVTGDSYMVVYANDEMDARRALGKALPHSTKQYLADYAFIYPWEFGGETFQQQIDAYELKPLSKHLFVGAVGDWSWQEGAE